MMSAEKKLIQYLVGLTHVPAVSERTKHEKPATVKPEEGVEININTNPWFNRLARKHK